MRQIKISLIKKRILFYNNYQMKKVVSTLVIGSLALTGALLLFSNSSTDSNSNFLQAQTKEES